ncbi:MAG: thioredoxin family protein [Candidatus Sumerlaeota bacterium]|nr:thioredoxin family protein [Candidatus Sumerlaeota bacterium]
MKSVLKWTVCALCVGMIGMSVIAAEKTKGAPAGKDSSAAKDSATSNTTIKQGYSATKTPVPATPTGATQWLHNFDEAKRQAKQTGRPIIANFTGSDWCPYCIKLDKEVLSQQAFKSYAKESLILFIADFPRMKRLPPAEAKANADLQKKYGVKGFPTVLLLDADGNKLGQTGYNEMTADKYVQNLKAILAKNTKKK